MQKNISNWFLIIPYSSRFVYIFCSSHIKTGLEYWNQVITLNLFNISRKLIQTRELYACIIYIFNIHFNKVSLIRHLLYWSEWNRNTGKYVNYARFKGNARKFSSDINTMRCFSLWIDSFRWYMKIIWKTYLMK